MKINALAEKSIGGFIGKIICILWLALFSTIIYAEDTSESKELSPEIKGVDLLTKWAALVNSSGLNAENIEKFVGGPLQYSYDIVTTNGVETQRKTLAFELKDKENSLGITSLVFNQNLKFGPRKVLTFNVDYKITCISSRELAYPQKYKLKYPQPYPIRPLQAIEFTTGPKPAYLVDRSYQSEKGLKAALYGVAISGEDWCATKFIVKDDH